MADVWLGGIHRRSRMQPVLASMENVCRRYDARITMCTWLLVVLGIWLVVADSLIGVDAIEYNGTWPSGDIARIEGISRVGARTTYRVQKVMEEQCLNDTDAVILGPQIRVGGEPYMFHLMTVCDVRTTLVNAHVAVAGLESGACMDELNGVTRRAQRSYPITIHSKDSPPSTFLELSEVCIVMHALDMLDGKW